MPGIGVKHYLLFGKPGVVQRSSLPSCECMLKCKHPLTDEGEPKGQEMKADKVIEAMQRTRTANLKKLIRMYVNASDLTRKLGYSSRASVSLMASGQRPITERTARRIEEKLKLETGWMDVRHKGD